MDTDGEEVIDCDELIAGDDEVALVDGEATLDDSAVDGSVVGSRVTLRSLRADAVVLFVECDARLDALALRVGTASTSFSLTTLLDFTDGVGGAFDSAGALGVLASAGACASVVAELLVVLVSATVGVAGAAAAVRAGFVTMTFDSTWRSNAYAPATTIATIAANAIPKCLTRFSVRDVIHLGMRDRPHSCGITGRSGLRLHA